MCLRHSGATHDILSIVCISILNRLHTSLRFISHGFHLVSSTFGPLVSKILREDNVLQSKEISLSHKCPHFLVDEIDVVFSFDNSVHIDVHNNIETVIYIGPHKCEDQLENFGCDIILNLADIDPFEGRL